MSRTLLIFLLMTISTIISKDYSKDPSTFSNYDQIIQRRIEGHYDIDFTNKLVYGEVKIYFDAIMDGELIILDTKDLSIDSVIDSDTGEEMTFTLDTRHTIKPLGTPLKIYKTYKSGDKVAILIIYKTTKEGDCIGWNDKEQTYTKEYPFMFTQGEPTKMRAFLPVQDTPSAKVVVSTSMTVIKPLVAVNSGVLQSVEDNGEKTTYFYHQKIPIPSYLIAIAAGALENRTISDRVIIYAEKGMVEKAAEELSQTEEFIQIAESYATPYEWGMYNLIVLPPSFPFGGMENPCMTFVTPTIIAGDKSMAYVVAHEISHSWSGNLVTMKTWKDFWINEGFTVYLERKINEIMNGEQYQLQSAQIGYHTMEGAILKYGENHEYTKLRYEIYQNDPDDAFSEIPYEKGFNFLYYIEKLIKEYTKLLTKMDVFQYIVKDWFNMYKYQTVEAEDWQKHLLERLTFYAGKDIANKIYNEIDWEGWYYKPGYPIVKNNFDNVLSKEVDEKVAAFFNSTLTEDFKKLFDGWKTNSKILFLQNIEDNEKGSKLSDQQYAFLNTTLNIKEGYNKEVNFEFFAIMLKNRKLTEINELDSFLGSMGRLKYIRPLYNELAKFNKAKSVEIFNKYKPIYNPIAVRLIEDDLKKIN